MPQPISLDLRQRATQAYLDGKGTQNEIAQRFCISNALPWFLESRRVWPECIKKWVDHSLNQVENWFS